MTENGLTPFFTPLANTKPYFKAAFEGFAGSGKTFTSSLLAIGLHKEIGSTKPIVIFDTEKAAKFLIPLFAEANIEALVKESRSLADLKETMAQMEAGVGDILVIDSISHVWEDFLEAFKNKPLQYGKSAKTRLEFQDWGILKPTWKKEFSDPFVRGAYHVIMTGRAGFEYENEINSETGKREIYKSGVKMKVEGETAYEPDLLVLMEQIEEVLDDRKLEVYPQAKILKDRSNLIHGKIIKRPDYGSFAPVVKFMLEGVTKPVTVAERDAADLFRTEEDKMEFKTQKKILLEEIEGYLVALWPGLDAKSKQTKADALFSAFSTRSWTSVEQLGVRELEEGYNRIQEFGKRKIAEEQRGALATKPIGPSDASSVEKLGKKGRAR